jgi:hypothetical protein
MQIEVVNRNMPGDASAVGRVKQRVRRSLDRLAHRVERVRVKVEALADRAGLASRECLVVLRLRGGGEIVVRKRGDGVVGPLFAALRQARGAAQRRIDRRR